MQEAFIHKRKPLLEAYVYIGHRYQKSYLQYTKEVLSRSLYL